MPKIVADTNVQLIHSIPWSTAFPFQHTNSSNFRFRNIWFQFGAFKNLPDILVSSIAPSLRKK